MTTSTSGAGPIGTVGGGRLAMKSPSSCGNFVMLLPAAAGGSSGPAGFGPAPSGSRSSAGPARRVHSRLISTHEIWRRVLCSNQDNAHSLPLLEPNNLES